MAKTKILICPYCGEMQPVGERCMACGGLFEPLSRQATHNAMGPWFVRNPMRPFQPGCSYETLVKMVERGQVVKTSIVRGPTSKQFWTAARRLPGIAHLLGCCHNCDASVDPGDHGCHSCGVPFGAYLDRNYLGLPEVKPLPWEAPVLEDRGGVPGSGAMGIDWQRAAEPMGLSSFASDRDLRGLGGQFVPAGSGLMANLGASGTATSLAAGAVGSSANAGLAMERASHTGGSHTSLAASNIESATSSAVARSLQRRVEEQTRTIRVLIMVMIALTALSVIIVALRFSGSGTTPGAAPSTRPKAATQPAANAPEAPATAPAIEPPATAPHLEFADELRRANQLMESAANVDRATTDRIKDYEDAEALLKGIIGRVPKAQQPRDLESKLKTIEKELSKLRLKQHFP